MKRWLWPVLLVLALPVAAQEAMETDGPLDDRSFYRLVACAAPPGGECQKPMVRWPNRVAKDLTVALRETDPDYPIGRVPLVSSAMDRAIRQINAVGADVSLRRVPDGEAAHIEVYLSDIEEGARITGYNLPASANITMGWMYVHIWWNDGQELVRGIIIVSPSAAQDDIPSMILEELVQSLGLLTDVEGDWYLARSIFAEDANIITTLDGQDANAIRQHYPRSP